MHNLLDITYARTGESMAANAMGMREMQARVWEKRNEQYLLLKAPPASGKSRALMFVALDKVIRQGRDKVIVTVPQKTIGASFRDTDLMSGGFFANWRVKREHDLCTGGDAGKVDTLIRFLEDNDSHYLVCTHATLRYAWDRLHAQGRVAVLFSKAVVAIDEFHHTSECEDNHLGLVVDDLMDNTGAHLVAMTGSYFRGDRIPILSPEKEARFTQVVYTYYEQLNGYRYLRSLGIGYHFYTGSYTDAVHEVLDLSKKTIVHIPNVNSRDSTGGKYNEVGHILDAIGEVREADENGILHVGTADGRTLKVADLVTEEGREKVTAYLKSMHAREDMDIIIALGMAKEGFDWPWCEHVLTCGYRSSFTEVVQIIGRATRDCPGKEHAQFTNLVAAPDARQDDVTDAVNDILKAITLSLLMRDVLAPNIMFRPRSSLKPGEEPGNYDVIVDDRNVPMSSRLGKKQEEGAVNDLITALYMDEEAQREGILRGNTKVVTEIVLPRVAKEKFPELSDEELQSLVYLAKAKMALDTPTPSIEIRGNRQSGNDDFVSFGSKVINVENLDIDLIDSVSPFLDAYKILSKDLDSARLKAIQDAVAPRKETIGEEEAVALWPRIKEFVGKNGVEPELQSFDAYEQRLALALDYLRRARARRKEN